jgi:hypothetical protein
MAISLEQLPDRRPPKNTPKSEGNKKTDQSSASEQISNKPVYIWLNEVELSRLDRELGGFLPPNFDPQAATLKAYNEFASQYAEVEWNPELIELVWNSYRQWILEIQNTEPTVGNQVKVLVGGVGTSRDPAIIALLNPKVHVTGYDAARQMVNQSRETLSWARLDVLMTTLKSLEPNLGGLIKPYFEAVRELDEMKTRSLSSLKRYEYWYQLSTSKQPPAAIRILDDLLSKPLEWLKKQLRQGLVKNLTNKIKLEVADHRQLPYKAESFDWIIDNATLQHLTRTEQKEAVAAKLAMLRPNGRYCFNLRLDNAPLRVNAQGIPVAADGDIRGRVFMDNRLNPEVLDPHEVGWRYYTTNSESEITELIEAINSGELLQKFGDAQSKARFRVVGSKTYRAGNWGSPEFVTIEVQRIA